MPNRSSDLVDEPRLHTELEAYFPAMLRERHAASIGQHRLRREIVATQLTNKVVDWLGMTFVHSAAATTGATPVDVLKTTLATLLAPDLEPFLLQLLAMDDRPAQDQYAALARTVEAVSNVVNGLLLADVHFDSIDEFVELYRPHLPRVLEALPDMMTGESMQRLRELHSESSLRLARLATMEFLPDAMAVVDVTRHAHVALDVAGRHYFALGESLSLGWVRQRLALLCPTERWEKTALCGLVHSLRQSERRLAVASATASTLVDQAPSVELWQRNQRLFTRYQQTLGAVRENDAVSQAEGDVLARLLEAAR